jgi:hypothetical protein
VPGLGLMKLLNGAHVPAAPGLVVSAGATLSFTYRVINASGFRVSTISLDDDRIGTISCPLSSLGPGQSMVCTAPAQLAVEGGDVNVATARGRGPDGGSVTATDRAYYTTGALPPAGAPSSALGVLGAALLALGLGASAIGHLPRRRQEGERR